MSAGLTLLLCLSLGSARGGTPESLRNQIVAARAGGEYGLSLSLLRELEQAHPAFHRGNDFDYLVAVVAEKSGEEEQAAAALARVVATKGPLADRASVRLARLLQHRDPKAALELMKGFANRYPDSAVTREARVLEVVSNARAGRFKTADARLRRLPKRSRREAMRLLLEVDREGGRTTSARARAVEILAGGTGDRAAYQAAELLVAEGADGLSESARLRFARALYNHRVFGPAMAELRSLADGARDLGVRSDALFLLGRSAMKAGDDAEGVLAFERLITLGGALGERALYQIGRLDQACGNDVDAIERYRTLARTGSTKRRYAAEARVKLVRIHAGAGRLAEARRLLGEIDGSKGPGSRWGVRGALAVAGAYLGRGDADGALALLVGRKTTDRDLRRELDYWRGVALDAAGRPGEAADAFERAARGTGLIGKLSRDRRLELSSGGATVPPAGLCDGQVAVVGLTGSPEPSPPSFAATPVRGHQRAADALLYLGLHGEAADELREVKGAKKNTQHIFQMAELAARGGELKTSVQYAEQLRSRLLPGEPPECIPEPIFALLYPHPWNDLITRAARTTGVDPDLVRSVMREESRFDPEAHSPAGARGLMQFIPETATRVGRGVGIDLTHPEMVHEPHIAIPLGAAYLAELVKLFDGSEGAAVAAYNAGEEAAYEWLQRTRGGRTDEFLREIEYSETRKYVDRVLSSLAAYRSRRVPPDDMLR